MAKKYWTTNRVRSTNWEAKHFPNDSWPWKVVDPETGHIAAHTLSQGNAERIIEELRKHGCCDSD